MPRAAARAGVQELARRCLLRIVSARRGERPGWTTRSWGEWWRGRAGPGELLQLALPLILSSSIWTLQTFIDRVMLGWLEHLRRQRRRVRRDDLLDAA